MITYNLLLVIYSLVILSYILLTGKLPVVIPDVVLLNYRLITCNLLVIISGIVTLNYILLIGKLTVVIPGVVISNMYTANRQLSGRHPKRRGF